MHELLRPERVGVSVLCASVAQNCTKLDVHSLVAASSFPRNNNNNNNDNSFALSKRDRLVWSQLLDNCCTRQDVNNIHPNWHTFSVPPAITGCPYIALT
jgi:hypothetical protein